MRIKKGIILQEMGDTYVAYDNDTSTIHELNDSAFFILQKIKDGKQKGEVIKAICKKYGVEEKEAQSDFDSFLKTLKDKKIVS